MQPIRLNLLGGNRGRLAMLRVADTTGRGLTRLPGPPPSPRPDPRQAGRPVLGGELGREGTIQPAASPVHAPGRCPGIEGPDRRRTRVAEPAPGQLQHGCRRVRGGGQSPQVVQWARALDLYRGDLLDGVHVRSNGFEAWLMGERQRLRLRAVGLMVRLLEAAEPDRDVDPALPWRCACCRSTPPRNSCTGLSCACTSGAASGPTRCVSIRAAGTPCGGNSQPRPSRKPSPSTGTSFKAPPEIRPGFRPGRAPLRPFCWPDANSRRAFFVAGTRPADRRDNRRASLPNILALASRSP